MADIGQSSFDTLVVPYLYRSWTQNEITQIRQKTLFWPVEKSYSVTKWQTEI